MNEIEQLKRQAAEKAVEYVRDGMVLGLGTGSTTAYAIQRIGERVQAGELKNIVGIPSSEKTARQALELGIHLTTFEQHPVIDLTIDGADEVDPQLNLIKGGGGALLREKVLAQNSKQVIIIVDESKLSPQLGSKWPLPVEVLPFAWQPAARFLESLGAKVTLRQDQQHIFETDQGNFILDCRFGPIENPEDLERRIKSRAGILEHGLFLGLAHRVIVAGKNGVQELEP